jgi:hypothetical protein
MRDIAAEAFAPPTSAPALATTTTAETAATTAATAAAVAAEEEEEDNGAMEVSEPYPSMPQTPALGRYIPRMVAFVRRLQEDIVGKVRASEPRLDPFPVLFLAPVQTLFRPLSRPCFGLSRPFLRPYPSPFLAPVVPHVVALSEPSPDPPWPVHRPSH